MPSMANVGTEYRVQSEAVLGRGEYACIVESRAWDV